MRKGLILSSVLIPSLLTALGCGLGDMVAEKASEKASEEIAEKIVEVSTGAQDVELDQNGASVKISTGEGTVQINSDGGGSLPADFPLASYSGAKVTGSTRMDANGKATFQVAMSSADAPKTIGAFYENELKSKGYQVNKVEMNADGKDSVMLQGEKSDSAASVTVASDNNESSIVIIIGAK